MGWGILMKIYYCVSGFGTRGRSIKASSHYRSFSLIFVKHDGGPQLQASSFNLTKNSWVDVLEWTVSKVDHNFVSILLPLCIALNRYSLLIQSTIIIIPPLPHQSHYWYLWQYFVRNLFIFLNFLQSLRMNHVVRKLDKILRVRWSCSSIISQGTICGRDSRIIVRNVFW